MNDHKDNSDYISHGNKLDIIAAILTVEISKLTESDSQSGNYGSKSLQTQQKQMEYYIRMKQTFSKNFM